MNGKAWTTPVSKNEVSKYWLSDLIHANTLLGSDGPPIAQFVWIVKILNGELISWSVPSIMPPLNCQSNDWQIVANMPKKPEGMPVLTPVCTQTRLPLEKRWLLGTCNALGKASDWIQQASSDTQMVISMGHVPESKFGCILQSGPSSLVFALPLSKELDVSIGSSGKQIFCQAPFLMTPPAFVASLHVLLIECASMCSEIEHVGNSEDGLVDPSLCKYQKRIQVRFSSSKFCGQGTYFSLYFCLPIRYCKSTYGIGYLRPQTKTR